MTKKTKIIFTISGIALLLAIVALVLSLTMCGMVGSGGLTIDGWTDSNQSSGFEISTNEEESDNLNSGTILNSIPNDPTDTFVKYNSRTEREIGELVEKTLKSGDLYGSFFIHIKDEYWNDKETWNTQNFPGIEFSHIEKSEEYQDEHYLWCLINTGDEKTFIDIAKKLYKFDYVEFVELAKAMSIE
jgi:hypothetical protein